jgi:multiple sugar transport system permease protein
MKERQPLHLATRRKVAAMSLFAFKGARATRFSKRLGGEAVAGLLFLSPALVGLIFLRLIPIADSLLRSFGGLPLPEVGWSIDVSLYRELFSFASFRQSVGRTLLFNAIINPLQIVIALALAALLSERIPARRLWRTLIFMPAAVPLAISAIIWGVALRPTDGLVNALLGDLGLPPQPFLTSPSQALWSIIVIASWAGVGYWMVFLIAGLQEVPREYREAAALDGAGWWRTFAWVILPLMRRPIAFVLVADTIANFLLFAPVQILTSGGPAGSTNFLIFDIYENAYVFTDKGLAAAEVMVLVALMLAIVTVQFRLLRSDT